MRPYFVFLSLLLWLIPVRADEQRVIKDSEAIRHVGRYVEVCGLVVSVTTSPFGTAFINFGREYPNQTFAGFIPADSGITADQITKLQGKNVGIVGTIELHRGKPEIKIMSMYQMVVIKSKSAEFLGLRLNALMRLGVAGPARMDVDFHNPSPDVGHSSATTIPS